MIPGLLGPWYLQDPVGWSDDVTLDCESTTEAPPPHPPQLNSHYILSTIYYNIIYIVIFSEAINTDLNRSQIMRANYDWPIANFANFANFAPIHPTGQVSIGSDNLTKTLARNTIWLVNNHRHWHGVNDICLSCPPAAARMMDKTDPYPFGPAVLLDTFEAALKETMQANFWSSMGGGGLEQVGATHAINELMLQTEL